MDVTATELPPSVIQQLSQATVPVQAEVPATPAAPASAAPGIDYAELARQLVALGLVQTPAPSTNPTPAEKPPVAANLWVKGQLVSYGYADHYAGGATLTRYGIVVETLPDEGAGARSVVAWFDGVSGPIGDQLLEAG